MNPLNTFLNLLARTDGRDQILRLIQYSSLHSVDHNIKGSTFKVYGQMRMVRKILRFFREFQILSKTIPQITELKKSIKYFPALFSHLTKILQNLFHIFFFITDHNVFLHEIGVISIKKPVEYRSKSLKFYFFQNFFGVIHNLIQMGLDIMKGHKNQDLQQARNKVKKLTFDLLRCLLDCVVAIYYLKSGLTAKKVGILGVVTSLMAIVQILGLM